MDESILLGATPREPEPADAAAPASLFAMVRQAIGDELPRLAARYVSADEARTRSSRT